MMGRSIAEHCLRLRTENCCTAPRIFKSTLTTALIGENGWVSQWKIWAGMKPSAGQQSGRPRGSTG